MNAAAQTLQRAAEITEPMRDRLPGKMVARLVIREEVVRLLLRFREGRDEHEQVEVDLAALNAAEGALYNIVEISLKTVLPAAEGINEPYCACGHRWSDCDGSRAKYHKREPARPLPAELCD